MTESILPLSGSPQGKPITITATSSPGTLIHTTGTSASVIDRMYLSIVQRDGQYVHPPVSIEFDGDTVVKLEIDRCPEPVCDLFHGQPLLGDGTAGVTVRMFCTGTLQDITVWGYVVRVTP